MAIYRQISISYWQDDFVLSLKPEEKYFYLYLMTNSKTTQCGIYEIPMAVMVLETGYTENQIKKMLLVFIQKEKIAYSPDTNEICICNWLKYNNSDSPKIKACIEREKERIKNTVLIQYAYSMDTRPNPDDTVLFGINTVCIPNRNNLNLNLNLKNNNKNKTNNKKQYKDYVFLTDEEYGKLKKDYGSLLDKKIEDLNNYIGSKGKQKEYKDHYLTIINWFNRDGIKKKGESKFTPEEYPKCPECGKDMIGGRCWPCIKKKIAEEEAEEMKESSEI